MTESEFREFMREQRLIEDRRHKRVMKALEDKRRAMELYHDRENRKLDHLLAEAEMQRAALWQIFDRLDSGGGAAPAG